MFVKVLSYFNYKYLLMYSWLIAIAIYISRAIWGYGSFITVVAQFWADFVGVLCFISMAIDYKEMDKRVLKVLVGVMGLLSISLMYFFISPGTVDMRDELLGEMASSYDQLKLLGFSLLAFIPSAQFTRKQILDRNIIVVYFFLIWFLSVILYFENYNLVSEHYGSNIVINNGGYLVLSLLPFCFVVTMPVRMLYLLSCVILCFMSAKRGAAIESAVFCAIAYYLSIKKFTKYKKFVFCILGVCLVYWAYKYFYDDISAIFLRLDRDGVGSASRNQVVSDILYGYFSGNIIDMFFGFGALSTVRFAGNFAHNDFLEVLCNYGILGLYFLLIIYINAFYKYREIRFTNIYTSKILIIALLTCLFKSFVSMNFYGPEGAIAMLAIGYSMCSLENKNTINE